MPDGGTGDPEVQGELNLALVIGVTSDEAASVVPVINASKMVVFGMAVQVAGNITAAQLRAVSS